ncbi:MAG: hypothetical protein DCC65_16105 [Planctomycetota bacterium]|nr:MAG: hypothetical protein DCC65_16105 [Planctomycetota bacterium]
MAVVVFAAAPAGAADEPFAASKSAAALDAQIDWSRARLIAVQDDGRYKTLDTFAREAFGAMYGKEHLPGLSPAASLMEWLFNRDAYLDAPVIRLKDKGVRIHLSAHMPEAARQRIQQTGYMTPRELADPVVQQRIAELEPMAPMVTAMRRVRGAEVVSKFMDQMFRVVPRPRGSSDELWHTMQELQANLPPELLARGGLFPGMGGGAGDPIAGISPDQAVKAMALWAGLWKGWSAGDAEKVQGAIDGLAAFLPSLAGEGVYPAEAQRSAEASYYAWGKFTWGYWIYMLGLLLAVPAVVTRWRAPWLISMGLLVAAMTLHAWGIGLRWFILGRIPVANMFEAIVGSAWIGIAVGLLIEWRYRTRFALVGAHATGFLALVLAGYVVPGGGTITTIMGILDDVMLRIHTVLIIASYALIFLASVIAVIYLFGYYYHKSAARSAEFGVIGAIMGIALWLVVGFVFQPSAEMAGDFVKNPKATLAFTIAAVATVLMLTLVARPGASPRAIAGLAGLLIACITLAIGSRGFAEGMAWTMTGAGTLWALGNLTGIALRNRAAWIGGPVPALAGAGANGRQRAGGAAADRAMMAASEAAMHKPLLAGALPGDRAGAAALPFWLQQADWCHLIILNMVFVMLFVGTILGAVWADYSWGRPWGWDPKEVFALNTWIIYAILIHMRFVTKDKGLWTAWLSVAGCLMMAFNWCFVNFYIVGLHSYA